MTQVYRPHSPFQLLCAAALLTACATDARKEWSNYGADKANTKYSTLHQINAGNFKDLEVAWRWQSLDQEILKARPELRTGFYQTTPLMVGGVLYASTALSQVAAIHPATGKTIWTYDPKAYEAGTPPNEGFVHRGVAYWADRNNRRIFVGTGDAHLIALDATSGKPIQSFGKEGRIDLTEGLSRHVVRSLYSVTSPPVVCGGVVVVGASILDYPAKDSPRGDVRGFDVRTGQQRWVFHTVPVAGEAGIETWQEDSWKTNGNTNVWSIMSCDEEAGYLYLPLSTPTNDFYGGHRPGSNLYAESLVALDAATGKRIWHFQTTHHGLWDYDLPAAPNLLDLKIAGREIKAVAQVSKQGYCYVFDRLTGKPLWPIEERPVAKSVAPGERTSPTQPVPTRPPPFDYQGISEDTLVDFTPEFRAEALAIMQQYNHGPLYTPPSVDKPTIVIPGVAGGASWAGAAVDPKTGWLFVPSVTLPFTVTLSKPNPEYSDAHYSGQFEYLPGPRGLFLTKPPYGRVTAIDLTTGEHRWLTAVGDGPREHPDLKNLNLPPLGWPMRIHLLLTDSLLFAGQEGLRTKNRLSQRGFAVEFDAAALDPSLRAYDKTNGNLVGAIPLPANVGAAPMTYMLDGQQYIVVAVGGSNLPAELVALRLPKKEKHQ